MNRGQENPYSSPESNVEVDALSGADRSALIPVWIKVFGWLFIVTSAATPLYLGWSLATGGAVSMALFGLTYVGPATNPLAYLSPVCSYFSASPPMA